MSVRGWRLALTTETGTERVQNSLDLQLQLGQLDDQVLVLAVEHHVVRSAVDEGTVLLERGLVELALDGLAVLEPATLAAQELLDLGLVDDLERLSREAGTERAASERHRLAGAFREEGAVLGEDVGDAVDEERALGRQRIDRRGVPGDDRLDLLVDLGLGLVELGLSFTELFEKRLELVNRFVFRDCQQWGSPSLESMFSILANKLYNKYRYISMVEREGILTTRFHGCRVIK